MTVPYKYIWVCKHEGREKLLKQPAKKLAHGQMSINEP